MRCEHSRVSMCWMLVRSLDGDESVWLWAVLGLQWLRDLPAASA